MSRYYNSYRDYVPVGERRANGFLRMQELRKAGATIEPVEIKGRTIARSFWGKGWCEHLESFSDFSNRLPRGRTYARNGSVCHLGIDAGKINAYVSGSDLYEVEINIAPLPAKDWKALKKTCTGNIGSLIELLQGRLSDEIMTKVTDRKRGLFPQPKQIEFSCSCPDWASMCKHVAAVLYGVGARLDHKPELLFHLRQVDHSELVADGSSVDAIVAGKSSRRRRTIDPDSLGSLFEIDMDEQPAPPTGRGKAKGKAKGKRKGKGTTKPKGPGKAKGTGRSQTRKTSRSKSRSSATTDGTQAFAPTPASITKLRARLQMNKSEFARAIGVSPPTITNWETSARPIQPRPDVLATLNTLHQTQT